VELVDMLRRVEQGWRLPILMISGRAQREHIAEAVRAGIDGYLLKPFSPFARAESRAAKALVIGIQANMWDPEALAAGGDGLLEYQPIVQTLADLCDQFARPVLLLNGDSHLFVADHPLATLGSATGAIHGTQAVPNLWRLTVQGSTNKPSEWLRLTIKPDAPLAFSWKNVVYLP
jgi:CheY-like chemotaxis protein